MDSMFKEIVLGIKTKEEDVEKTESKLRQFTDGFSKYFKESFSKSAENAGVNLAESLMKNLKKVADFFKNTIKDSWYELQDMVSSSYLTNPITRQNAFTYGLSAGESYGFEQAKSMMGISEEDLMYMESHQAQKFQEIMSKYSEKYNELYDSGFFEQMMDYQIEMQEFQQDIKLEVVKWIVDNKDLIKAGMEAIMKLTDFTIRALGWLVNNFGGGNLTSYSDSRVNNSNIITNNNINVDNTFNGSNSTDQSNMTNPGIMTYEQVLKVLNN